MLQFTNNNIINFNINPLVGVNNNISIDLEMNDMTTVSMDQLITDLVAKGWTDGTLNFINQSTGNTPTTGAADYITLDTVLNWTILF